MPKILTRKKSQDSEDSDPDDSKLKQNNILNACSDDDDPDQEINLTSKRISKNDPLLTQGFSMSDLQGSAQKDPSGVTDKEWEESLRMSKKQIPGIQVPALSPAKKRRRKLELQEQGRKAFNEGQYKISPSIKNHQIYEELIQGISI